ncbi:MAG: replication-associated recombination protein A, partial [Microthrixaceae bacterium]|nr:replication-associated recombination protein A [Microthrixaceae bacterium]
LGRAVADVRSGPVGEVPAHLRDASYRSAGGFGHGVGYDYPHDDPAGWVPQRYLPEVLGNAEYYRGSVHGREQAMVAAWQARTARVPPTQPTEVQDR